jgi:LPXTG-motif cell wall-anchored protein
MALTEKQKKTIKWSAIGLGSVIVIGLTVYFIRKRRKK